MKLVLEYCKHRITQLDTRFLIAVVFAASIAVWVLPLMWVLLFDGIALFVFTLYFFSFRKGPLIVKSILVFISLWAVSIFFLSLWEAGDSSVAAFKAVGLWVRWLAMMGMALLVSMSATPIQTGRAVVWFCNIVCWPEVWLCQLPFLKGKVKPYMRTQTWKVGLALTLMMSLIPQVFMVITQVRQTLKLRGRGIGTIQSVTLVMLAILRSMSRYTWDMSVSVSARNLFRQEVWEWKM